MTLVLVLLIHKAIRPYDCYVPCSFVDTKSHKAIMAPPLVPWHDFYRNNTKFVWLSRSLAWSNLFSYCIVENERRTDENLNSEYVRHGTCLRSL